MLLHGAGSNCEAPLMVAVAAAFAEIEWLALRCDLYYRQQRPRGAPANTALRDQESIRTAARALAEVAPNCPVYLGGQSYGGRMATMLAAGDPGVGRSLLLLSYPLHPPGQAAKLRTEHFPKLSLPALFVHGTRDPFGTIAELESAIRLIPGRTQLVSVQGAGHGVPPKTAPQIARWYSDFVGKEKA